MRQQRFLRAAQPRQPVVTAFGELAIAGMLARIQNLPKILKLRARHRRNVEGNAIHRVVRDLLMETGAVSFTCIGPPAQSTATLGADSRFLPPKISPRVEGHHEPL